MPRQPRLGGSPPADMLRALRRESELTQERLADLAGVHVRTIRGLESGRIVAPHLRSLELIAQALGLNATAELHFLAGWGIEGRYSFGTAIRGGHHDTPQLDELLLRSATSWNVVSTHELVDVGEDHTVRRRRTEDVLMALSDGVQERYVLFDFADDPIDVKKVRLSALDNCHVAWTDVDSTRSTVLYALSHARALGHGEVRVIRYTLDLSAAILERPSHLPTFGREIGGLVKTPATYVLRIRFAAGSEPSRTMQVFQATPGAPTRDVKQLDIADSQAILALTAPRPGGHGITWEW